MEPRAVTVDPYAWLAHAPIVRLEVGRLPDDEMGRWIPELDMIVLDDRLTQVERRCTLAHEMLHRYNDDSPDLPEHLLLLQERQCRERTARLLIRLQDLADALLWSAQDNELAEVLWVDVPTLRDRLDTLHEDEKAYIECRLAARGDAA